MTWRVLDDSPQTADEVAVEVEAVRRARANISHVPRLWLPGWRPTQGLAPLLGPVLDRFRRRLNAGQRPRLLLHAPPRHGKTEQVGKALGPVAMWDRPGRSVVYGTSDEDRAVDVSSHAMRLTARLAELGYAAHLAPGTKRRSDDWNTKGGGAWVGVGVGSSTGGIPAGLGVVDDVTGSAAKYRSKAKRLETRKWLVNDVFSRDSGDAGFVVMETRRGIDDIHAWLEREYPGLWEVVTIPHVSAEGAYLWPERYGPTWREASDVAERFCATNPTARQKWKSVHQGEPEAEGGAVWTREMFAGRYPGSPEARRALCDVTALSIDPASTSGGGNASAVWLLGWKGAVCYVLARESGHWGYPELRQIIRDKRAQFRPSAVLVENTSNGRAVVQELDREIPGLTPIDATKGKRAGMEAVSPQLAAGQVLFPEPQPYAPWLYDVIDGFVTLTGIGDEEDDDADALRQALEWRAEGGVFDVSAYLRAVG